MQLQDVAFADHEVTRNHNSVNFALAPDSSVLDVLDEIAMDLLGNIQNCTPSSDNIGLSEIRFLSGSLRIDTNDVQKIVHESFELFYLNRRRGCCGNGCHLKRTSMYLANDCRTLCGSRRIILIPNN